MTTERFSRLLALGWLLLALMPVHNFIQRPNTQAVSEVGLEPILEVTYFGVVGLLALAVVRGLEPSVTAARPPVALGLLPLWICLTSVWSETGPYALIRGIEMLVVVALGGATIALGRAVPDALGTLVDLWLRWFVVATVLLTGAGLAFGNVLVPASGDNLERFSWIGAHPNGSGLVLAIAILIVVAAPHRAIPLTLVLRGLVAAGFAFLLLMNHSRTSWLSLVIGLAVVLAIGARRSAAVRLALPPMLVVATVAIVMSAGALADYFLRGQRSESLSTGNGRLRLWPIGFDNLDSPFDWLFGLGYGSARTVFVAELSWAKTAHNSVLALLVSGGLVAVVLLGVMVATTFTSMWRSRFATSSTHGVVLTGILAALLTNGLASDVMAEPNIGFVGLVFVAAITRIHASSLARSTSDQTSSARATSRSAASSISTQEESGGATDR